MTDLVNLIDSYTVINSNDHGELGAEPLDKRVYLPPLHKIFPRRVPMRWHKIRKSASVFKQATIFLTSVPPIFQGKNNEGWELGAESLEYAVKYRIFERFTREDFKSTVEVLIPSKTRSGRVSNAHLYSEVVPEEEKSNAPMIELSLVEQQNLLKRLGPLPAVNPFLVYYRIAGYTNDELLECAHKYKLDRDEDDAQERAKKRSRVVYDPQCLENRYRSFMTSTPEVLGLRDLEAAKATSTPAPHSSSSLNGIDSSHSIDCYGKSTRKQKIMMDSIEFCIESAEWKPFAKFEAEWEAGDPDEVKALKSKKKYLVAGLYSAHYKIHSPTALVGPTQPNIPARLDFEYEKISDIASPFNGRSVNVVPIDADTEKASRYLSGNDSIDATVSTPRATVVADTFRFPLPRNFGEIILKTKKNFEIPLDIAMIVEAKGGSNLLKTGLINKDPAPFQRLTRNLFVDRKPRKVFEIAICRCNLSENGTPACGENCLNRCMFIECNPEHCPCGEACTNQMFYKRDFVKELKVVWTGSRGHGLVTNINIPAGRLVMEYCGEIISAKAYADRMEKDYMNSHNFYSMVYGDNEVIDAGKKGTDARFVNHSCDPNCQIEKWFVGGEYSIGLFALKNIPAGAELTYDYRFQPVFEGIMKECLCGSAKCRGFLGNNKKKEELKEELSDSKKTKTQTKASQNRLNKNAIDRSYWIRRHAREKLISQAKYVIKHKDYHLANRPFLIRNLMSKVRVESLAENVGIIAVPVIGQAKRMPNNNSVSGDMNRVLLPSGNGLSNSLNGMKGSTIEKSQRVVKTLKKDNNKKPPTTQTFTDKVIRNRKERRNRSIEAITEDLYTTRRKVLRALAS